MIFMLPMVVILGTILAAICQDIKLSGARDVSPKSKNLADDNKVLIG